MIANLLCFEYAGAPYVRLLQSRSANDPDRFEVADALPYGQREVFGIQDHDVVEYAQVTGAQRAD